MRNKILNAMVIFTALSAVSPAFGEGFYEHIKFVNPIPQPTLNVNYETKTPQTPQKASLTKNNIRNQFVIAFDRFKQSNVKASYNDYKILIETMQPNDYAYMVITEKMAAIGFFDLADLSASKIKDKNYSTFLVDDIQKFYFPIKKLKKNDEIYLAEIFSNITYNDQSKEATAELVKNTDLLIKSDYANYIAALGYLKSNDIPLAVKYINQAISMNNDNLNYKKLKAEILVQSKNQKEALEIVNYLKKQNMYSMEFSRKINATEQYILYKTAKKDADKNYHLGYYYYFEKEYAKSIRALQSASMNKKKTPREVYSLLSRVYFDTRDFEKALDNAQKARKLDGSDSMALEVLGDLAAREKDYKNALKYYKDAADKDKKNPDAMVKTAQIYQKTGAEKKAIEIYTKILKAYTNCYIAYYEVALYDKSKEKDYLKKAVAINRDFKDGWIDLARIEIGLKNYNNAKEYLSIANYIDENDFRYYYYQGLIFKAEGFKDDANYNFKKSLLINPDYAPAKEELSI